MTSVQATIKEMEALMNDEVFLADLELVKTQSRGYLAAMKRIRAHTSSMDKINKKYRKASCDAVRKPTK